MAHSNFRFSIRAILVVTGYTAMAVAALVKPNELWLGTIYGITVALLFYSLLGVIYRSDRARAYWTGFALFGIGYLALIFGPLSELSSKLPTTLLLDYTCEKFHGQVYPVISSGPYYPPPATSIPGPIISEPVHPDIALDTSLTSEPSETTPAAEDKSETEEKADVKADAETEVTSVSGSLPPTVNPYLPTFAVPSYSVPVMTYPYDDYRNFTEIGQAICALLFAAIGGLIAQCLSSSRSAKPVPIANASM